jgi:hypothetical protein
MKKKLSLVLFSLIVFTQAYSQVSSTGLVVLDSFMSFQLDNDTQNSVVTLTLKGPADRWFALGFNSLLMDTNTDCVIMTADNQLTDAYIPDAFHHAPLADASNDWTLVTNTVDAGIRTITATRAYVTGDAHDYDFSALPNPMDFIWAYSYYPIYDLYDPVNSGHGSDNYGNVTANFTTLGTIQHATSYEVVAYPNPVTDVLHLSFCASTAQTATVELYNAVHQRVYQQELSNLSAVCSIPTASFPKGVYYVALKMEGFQSIKKIIIGNEKVL